MRFHHLKHAVEEVTAVLLALAIGLGPPWLKGLLIPVDQAGSNGFETPEVLAVFRPFSTFSQLQTRCSHDFQCFSMVQTMSIDFDLPHISYIE